MPDNKSKLNWCLADERRMRKILPNDKISREHLEKAKHNLFDSKNHECTFNTIEILIESGEIDFSREDLTFIRTTEQMTPKDAKSLREEFQYGTKTEVNEVLLSELLQKSKAIVEKIEVLLSGMN